MEGKFFGAAEIHLLSVFGKLFQIFIDAAHVFQVDPDIVERKIGDLERLR